MLIQCEILLSRAVWGLEDPCFASDGQYSWDASSAGVIVLVFESRDVFCGVRGIGPLDNFALDVTSDSAGLLVRIRSPDGVSFSRAMGTKLLVVGSNGVNASD